MGLVAFGRHRIGFWMAERTGAPEIPAGLVAHVEGTPVPDGSTLVLIGADEEGTPDWALVLHAPIGASLLVPWGDRLLVGLGSVALLLNEDGQVLARMQFGDELLSAWPVSGGMLLFGRGGARLVSREGRELWHRPLEADGYQPLDLEGDRFRIAAMRLDGWDEVLIDAGSGAIVERP